MQGGESLLACTLRMHCTHTCTAAAPLCPQPAALSLALPSAAQPRPAVHALAGLRAAHGTGSARARVGGQFADRRYVRAFLAFLGRSSSASGSIFSPVTAWAEGGARTAAARPPRPPSTARRDDRAGIGSCSAPAPAQKVRSTEESERPTISHGAAFAKLARRTREVWVEGEMQRTQPDFSKRLKASCSLNDAKTVRICGFELFACRAACRRIAALRAASKRGQWSMRADSWCG